MGDILDLEGKTIRYYVNKEEDVSKLHHSASELPIELEVPGEDLEDMFENIVLSVDNTGENDFVFYLDIFEELPQHRTHDRLLASIRPHYADVEIESCFDKYAVIKYSVSGVKKSAEVRFWDGPPM